MNKNPNDADMQQPSDPASEALGPHEPSKQNHTAKNISLAVAIAIVASLVVFSVYVAVTKWSADTAVLPTMPEVQEEVTDDTFVRLEEMYPDRLFGLLKLEPETQTPAEVSILYAEAEAFAVDSDTIDVSNCDPYPVVTGAPFNSTITLQNAGSDEVSVVLAGVEYILSPDSFAKTLIDFDTVVTPYSCNDIAHAGVIFVGDGSVNLN